MEGVTCGIAECLAALERFGPRPAKVRVTGGGAASPFWLQLLCDTTGLECATMALDEGPSLGAAVLAGVGTGVWPDVAAASRVVAREDRSFRPSGPPATGVLERYRERRRVPE